MVKRISHKEVRRRMKMNEMEEARHWVERLWNEHGQKISWGLLGVAVLAVVIYLYADSREKGQKQAMALYGEALATAVTENPEEALPLVEQIVGQFSSSPVYPLALMLKGDLLYGQDAAEEAIAAYAEALRLDPDYAVAEANLEAARAAMSP